MGRNFKAESNSFFAELSLLFNQEIKIKEVPRVYASCIHNSLLRWRGQVWAHLVATIQDPRKVTLSTMTLKEKLNAMHRLWSRETTVLNPDSVVIGLGHKTSQWNVESLCPDLGEVDHSRPCFYPETQETLLCHLVMPALNSWSIQHDDHCHLEKEDVPFSTTLTSVILWKRDSMFICLSNNNLKDGLLVICMTSL